MEVKVAKKTNSRPDIKARTLDKRGALVSAKVSLPGDMFNVEPNKVLVSQAIRVYLTNQRMGSANTKTRGEVVGSTRKIYRQKGTGRARHGSVKAPIFVGGGIVSGPRKKDYSLKLTKKMKKQALFSSLSAKASAENVVVITGISDIEPKTKEAIKFISKIGKGPKTPKMIFLVPKDSDNLKKAVRNVENVTFIPATQINPYEVLRNEYIVIVKEAIDEMRNHFLKNN